jgi:dTDP-4-dehydrorhamnose reductase
MSVLVLGAGGMMGHMACRVLAESHDVVGTIRSEWHDRSAIARFVPRDLCIDGVDVLDVREVERVLDTVRPDVVFNCVGIVKQLSAAKDAVQSIECNSLLPHRLAISCADRDVRLIHLSTDCVFSGHRGMYTEDDIPDPVDLYGRSKLLGETAPEEGLTIRTSIVGRQLTGSTSFFEWVLSSRGQRVRGFDRAVYSGVTTMTLARTVATVIDEHADLSGVWQIASAPITKFELIVRLNELLDLGIEVDRDVAMECDRSLDGSRFENHTGIVVPSWDDMLAEFVADQRSYSGLEASK